MQGTEYKSLFVELLVLYSPFKKLVFVPVASAKTDAHRDHFVLASNAQGSEIQPLVLRGQITSADHDLCNRQMDTTTIL